MSGVKSGLKSKRHQAFRPHWQAQLTDYVTAIVATDRLVAATSAAGEIAVWAWETGDCLWRDRFDLPLSGAAFSDDGAWLAAIGRGGCTRVWATADFAASPQTVPVPTSVWVDRLAWEPDAPRLALNVNRAIWIWDAAARSTLTELDFADSSVLGLAWHPQGTRLAACGHTGTKVWDARDWTTDPYLLRVPGASLDAAWSPDGAFLAAGNFDRTLSILQWSSPPPWLLQGFPAKVRQVAWAANGQSLAAVCAEGIAIWHWDRQTWKNQRVLQGHAGSVRAIAFHENQLASVGDDARICLWQGAKKLAQTCKGPANGGSSLVWHPAGTAIAIGGCNGEVYIWQQRPAARGFA